MTAFDDVEERTSLAFLKGLLSRLLERSVGNVQLYESLAYAFEADEAQHDARELEAALWKSLHTGLKTFKRSDEPIVILVDSFDGVGGGHSPMDFFKSLKDCVSKLSSVRAIIFSRPISHLSSGCKHININREQNYADIRAFLLQALSKSSSFLEMQPSAQDDFVGKLADKAKGSFLWARLVASLLLQQHTHDGLLKAGQAMKPDASEALHAVEARMDMKSDAVQHLLSFML